MSIYLGDKLISGIATPVQPTRNIGQIIPSLLPLTDAGLHLLDGALIDGNGIYKGFVDYIKTIALTYSTCFVTEADWQTQVTQFGVCGKFVYNATNHTVRLPKVTGFVEGTLDANALGDLVEAGLPNITGDVTIGNKIISGDQGNKIDGASGAFTLESNSKNSSYVNSYHDGTKTYNNKFLLDASRSNPIYGNSDTVQPQSIKGYLYIVIATGTKTDVEVDIDNVATDINSKADIDLSNSVGAMSASAKSHFASMGMPSENYIDLTLGTSGSEYTAPANGWYVFKKKTSGTNQYATLDTPNGCAICSAQNASGSLCYVYLPAVKGQVVKTWYTAGGATTMFRFIYAEGEVAE